MGWFCSPARDRRLGILAGIGLWYSSIACECAGVWGKESKGVEWFAICVDVPVREERDRV